MLFWLGELTRNSAMKALVVVAGVIIIGMSFIGHRRCEDDSLKDRARAEALQRCSSSERGSRDCETLIENNHEDCGRISMVRREKYSEAPRRIDSDKYYRCVMLGYEEFQAQRRKERERQQAEEKTYLP